MVGMEDTMTERCEGCGELDADLSRREHYCTECKLECERCGDSRAVLRELPSRERLCYWCCTDTGERGGYYVQAPDGTRLGSSA